MDFKKSKTIYINRCNNKRKDNCRDIEFNKNAITTEKSTNRIFIETSSSHQNQLKISVNGNITNKRKRRSDADEKDIEYENPAKRIYCSNINSNSNSNNELHNSEVNSLASSYPSPLNDDDDDDDADNIGIGIGRNEITTVENSETRSSSDCLSTVAEYDLGTPCSSTSRNGNDLGNNGNDNGTPTSSSSSSSSSTSGSYHSSNTSTINSDNKKEWQQQIIGNVTPHHGCRIRSTDSGSDDCRSSVCVTPVSEIPMCPLPALSWANALDIWNLMCRNDEIAAYDRNSSMLENHPGLQPRMRAILLDWLIELCEVYKLHRETYYLAVDYLDRYLTATKNVQKTHLQLIGITCLFVAAKVEEIYPPKLGEFAYVTDGACQEEDILQHELLLLKALDWDVSPVTIMGWLGVYMQLNVSNRTPSSFSQTDIEKKLTSSSSLKNSDNLQRHSNSNSCNSNNNNNNSNNISNSNSNSRNNLTTCTAPPYRNCSIKENNMINDSGVSVTTPLSCLNNSSFENDDAFIYPQFSGMEFVQTAQLLDLCSMDVGIGNFRYSVIAAAAMSHTFSRQTALRVSGFDWNTIAPCAKWMEPFFSIVCEESQHVYLLEQDEQVQTKFGLGHICPNIITDDSHIIQTHTTSMNMFDKLVLRREQFNTAKNHQEASPAVSFICPEGLLTPPASSRKPLENDDNDGDDDDDDDDDHDEDNNTNNNNNVNNQSDHDDGGDSDHHNDKYDVYGENNENKLLTTYKDILK